MLDNRSLIRRGSMPRPSQIWRPGLPTLADNVERYPVAGRGAAVVALEAGDQIRIRNVEGGQACHLLSVDETGKANPGILNAPANTDATALTDLINDPGLGMQQIRSALIRRSVDLAKSKVIALFGGVSPAGDVAEFTAERSGLLIVATPAPRMRMDAHDTATPVELFVTRTKSRGPGIVRLPEPLSDPLQDIRIQKATAQSFFVKAGEYIQVIDVEGRQCSDFQCFSARKLDAGRQLPLDATTTRTLVAQQYPMPGLFAKSFDVEMDPLVEVIQDTCGRHDAFALACAARYYDDLGYPGHANCSENFNGALASYTIDARPGWMALNFFYNTGLDDNGVLYLDEPWSRPGDYVLMRALTDLVCVSSACPCDIDAANGWNPTDIHVRTYSDKETYSRSVAFRMTPDADPQMTKETAFHSSLSKLTRSFTEYNGYWLPTSFTNHGAIAEYWACREKAVIVDLSPLRKIEVTGPDAETLMNYALTRNVRKLSVGQVVYSAMCYAHGGMIDDGTLLRLGDENFRWIGGTDYGGVWLRELTDKLGLKVMVRSSTDQMHNIAVQGPESRDILKEIIWTSPTQPTIEELGWFRFTVCRLHGFDGIPLVISRTGYTGELGYEIWCHPRDAEKVFEAVSAAGEPHGITPMGLDALDMVRIEAGLIFAGYEFTDETDPYEAGIGFTVALKSKNEDFMGKEALVRRKDHPHRKLVGLEIDSKDPVGAGSCIHIGRAQIGTVTSAMRSPILDRQIALARLDVAHSELGTEVEIGALDGHQKRYPATVVRFPHYDPDKSRVRA